MLELMVKHCTRIGRTMCSISACIVCTRTATHDHWSSIIIVYGYEAWENVGVDCKRLDLSLIVRSMIIVNH